MLGSLHRAGPRVPQHLFRDRQRSGSAPRGVGVRSGNRLVAADPDVVGLSFGEGADVFR